MEIDEEKNRRVVVETAIDIFARLVIVPEVENEIKTCINFSITCAEAFAAELGKKGYLK